MHEVHQGPFGTAERIGFDRELPQAAQTLDYWLITAPVYHPVWSQYVLACVRLDDGVPGFGPPKRQFPGATHEGAGRRTQPGTRPADPDAPVEPIVALLSEATGTALVFLHAGGEGLGSQKSMDLADLVIQALRHDEECHQGEGAGADIEQGWRCEHCQSIDLRAGDDEPKCPGCDRTRRQVTVACGETASRDEPVDLDRHVQ